MTFNSHVWRWTGWRAYWPVAALAVAASACCFAIAFIAVAIGKLVF